MIQLSPRQIHLDFHTTELIPDIGAEFIPEQFAKTFKEAAVSSVTLFARCHHGWLYYPSEKFPELVHPNLKNKNFLLEQVRALHKEGIRAPIYITVQWDYYHATRRPEWLIRSESGSHEGSSFNDPGFYQSLCVNTTYYDFLEAQTREICEMLGDELDGVFFDIVGIRPCQCASCRNEMTELGINTKDQYQVREFASSVMTRFKKNMTAVVREYSGDCTIFYNAGHIGPCTKDSAESFTHYELESLPSGGWGYLHFPATIRYARKLGADCMGMTGKFHTSWGDFQSLKNQAALEFECFRMLSFGAACSIGDQLEPNGKVNQATYKLIGNIYRKYAELEEYGRPAAPVVEAAVLTNEHKLYEGHLSDEILGACQMLEEISLQFDIIDADMDFSEYKLIIVPDGYSIDEAASDKIDTYVKNGGAVISAVSGTKAIESKYPESFGVQFVKPLEKHPDFLVADGILADGLETGAEYVMYMQGAKLKSTGADVIMSAKSPYFSREGNRFCSHKYTPSAHGEAYPSVFKNGNVIVFSHPIFNQYRNNAPMWCKIVMKNAVNTLLPKQVVTHNGPSTMCVSVLDQPEMNRVNVHLLSYIPVRKSASIDIIEEKTKLNDVTLTLNLPYEIKSARCAISGQLIEVSGKSVEINGNSVCVSEIDGYEILVLEY